MASLLKIQEAAQARLRETMGEQERVCEKIREGAILDAEEDESRKIAYMTRKFNIGRDLARAVVNKSVTSFTPGTDGAESLQGDTVDFMGIQFLELASAAAKSIARVIFKNGSPQGTGFMISPQLFMTNNHVIPDKDAATGLLLEFNYQANYMNTPLPYTRFELDPDTFYYTNSKDDLDFALVAVGKKVYGPMELGDLSYLPLINSKDKHIKGIFVNCVQHPNGMLKQLVVRENRLLDRTDNTLIYSSDTLPGASGAPVFNDEWEVVALHHWGQPYRAFMDNVPDNFPKTGNEGIRISSIVNHLQSVATFNTPEKALVQVAVNPQTRYPSDIDKGTVVPVGENYQSSTSTSSSSKIQKYTDMPGNTEPKTNNNGDYTATQAGAVSFTIPLTVTIQIGEPKPVNAASQTIYAKNGGNGKMTGTAGEAAGAEALKPDANYKNRKGYDPDFLGIHVAMPRLNDEQKQDAAKNLQPAAGQKNPFELKYQHFSIVMNGKRRLPFFTAVNIDGGSVVKINRQTGKVTRGPESLEAGEEAREKWFDDDRIDDTQICHDSLYMQKEMKIFQRGHLVKRTDPSWGTESRAIKGQADTFHFTNCSPQHFLFNPVKSRWAGVEDWITDTSDNENFRVTVFSGPVFDYNPEKEDTSGKDFQIEYLKIPKAFWKVIVWTEDGGLRTTAILADQSDLLRESGAEGLDALPDKLPEEYHCAVAFIEQLTGLSFGLPEDADSFPASESIGRKRKIKEFNDIIPRRQKSNMVV